MAAMNQCQETLSMTQCPGGTPDSMISTLGQYVSPKQMKIGSVWKKILKNECELLRFIDLFNKYLLSIMLNAGVPVMGRNQKVPWSHEI